MSEENTGFLAKIPPNDSQAEDAILSSMLFDREAIASAYEIIRAEDFYRPDNQGMFETMLELFLRGVPVDVVTLSDRLAEKGILDNVGGRTRIAEIASAYYTSANIKHYSKIVSEKSVLRKLIKAATDIEIACYEAHNEVDYILEQAERLVFNIVQNRNVSDFAPLHEVLLRTLDDLDELARNQGKITGIPTGFTDFDNRTAGLHPSDLILLGARPSMGKSALMLNIAHHVAIKQQMPVAYFTLEMSKEQCANRMLCAEANLDAQKMRTGKLNDDDWLKIAEAVAPLSKGALYIDDSPGISVNELRAKCRRLKMEKGLRLIMVDYLQLMTVSGRTESRQLEISEISRSLKGIAKELDCPVFTAAQLSRAVEARGDHRPMLSDLRESGAIEQDADVVAFLYREEYYKPDTEKKSQAELIIAKQRNGPTGTVDLTWLSQYTKFANAPVGGFK
ncbi:MAG: replicative DNA helicase [Clostridiales bacterium]|jgi:replicative DNA helicase|nr:replicative DNA helicase [Clostridiales bacterium]